MSALKRPRIGCVAERRMSAAAMIRSPRKERLGAFGTCQSQSSLAIEEACAIATNESPTGMLGGGMFRRVAAGAEELGGERTTDGTSAKRGRVSTDAAGARSALHFRTL